MHLLDQQRFTEGHLIAEWLGPSLASGRILEQFRYGYTFDQLRSLLAEPAGHSQTAVRWSKHAESRLRRRGALDRDQVEEALLITARLELRARRNSPRGLSGHLHGRLLQLAQQLKVRGETARAASVFMMLAQALHPGTPERLVHLNQAVDCSPERRYQKALAQEKATVGEE